MRVAVNLITWNGSRYIKKCLESLFAQTFTDFELLIIDNGSTDDTLELIREKYPHLKIVEHRSNEGFAKAHNQAMHWTKSDYVLVLNQDIILEPDYLKEVVTFLDQNPAAGSAQGKLLKFMDDTQTRYIDTLGLKIFRNQRVIDDGQGEVDSGQYDTIAEMFGISGAIAMYRRTALVSVQYENEFFDEDFFSYKEDVDMAYRLRWAGWKAYMVPTGIAYHDRTVSGPSESLSKWQIIKNRRKKSSFANYYSYRNHWYMVIKNLPGTSWHFVWPVVWYELGKFLYLLFAEQKQLKTVREVWRRRKYFYTKRAYIQAHKKVDAAAIEQWFV